MIDIAQASEFMRTNARLLDRRRFELLFANGSAEAALAALSGYANPDGGFGYGLEPDLRSVSSQPGGRCTRSSCSRTSHRRRAQSGCGCATGSTRSRSTMARCRSRSRSKTEPVRRRSGSTPIPPSPRCSSPAPSPTWLADGDPAVAAHPWLESVIEYCLTAIAATKDLPFAIAFRYILQFLDAIHDKRTEAPGELARPGRCCPSPDRFRSSAAPREKVDAARHLPRPRSSTA